MRRMAQGGASVLAPSRVLSRAGAKLGDGIFVTGTLGGAALGLRLLQRGMPSDTASASASPARPDANRLSG